MWKVRIVSWVPGSPIDWAAITPTASPELTSTATTQVAAIAFGAQTVAGIAGQRRANAHFINAQTPRWLVDRVFVEHDVPVS